MIIEFQGATRTVTGSMHLLHINGSTVLLDCGLFQGKRAESIDRNKNFPFDPKSIDAVILSHAHIDHSGNLPNLVKQGYTGPIYCTPATQDLSTIMLKDSGFIQEKDTEFLNKQKAKHHEQPITVVYCRRCRKGFRIIPEYSLRKRISGSEECKGEIFRCRAHSRFGIHPD